MTQLHLQFSFDICRFGMLFSTANVANLSIAPTHYVGMSHVVRHSAAAGRYVYADVQQR